MPLSSEASQKRLVLGIADNELASVYVLVAGLCLRTLPGAEGAVRLFCPEWEWAGSWHWWLPAAPLLLLPRACERGHGAAWPRASGVPPGGRTGCRAMPNSVYAAPASCRVGEEPWVRLVAWHGHALSKGCVYAGCCWSSAARACSRSAGLAARTAGLGPRVWKWDAAESGRRKSQGFMNVF